MALISILFAGFLSCPLACDGPDRPDVRGMMAPIVDLRRSAGQALDGVVCMALSSKPRADFRRIKRIYIKTRGW